MTSSRQVIAFINLGHVIDHMFMLLFPTALLGMGKDFPEPYGAMLSVALGGFIAFGAGSLPAGWLADRWSQRNMMVVFFIGIGCAAIGTGFATTKTDLCIWLTAVGLFASIYHPVGTAMLVSHADKVGYQIGVNGVWGNLGIAFAALVAGALTQYLGWRWAFWIPGAIACVIGLLYMRLIPSEKNRQRVAITKVANFPKSAVFRAFIALIFATIAGGLVFNATTVALPQLFSERVPALANTVSAVGFLVSAVYAIGAISQLLVGLAVDRHPMKLTFLPLAFLQGPFLLLAAMTSGWWTVSAMIGAIFTIFGQVTINDSMVAKYAHSSWTGRVYAIRYLLSFTASAFAVPLVANLHDRYGFIVLFQALASFGIVVLLSAVAFPYRRDELTQH